MDIWFECKVSYYKNDDNGGTKKVTENYLFEAISYTEAEKRVYEEMEKMVSGDFVISKIAKTNISEIMSNDDETADRWFKAKLAYKLTDENSGKDKTASQYTLVIAKSIKNTFEIIQENTKGQYEDFDITAINLTTYLDVFPVFGGDKE